jgi:DNA-directed RNA polymerase subunit alpha
MRIRWRGLELPSQVSADRSTLTSTFGKFTVEPFERGFGVTIGNSLRRVLLSSLEGSAVTQIKLHGAQHEFTTLPGVLEDVTDIVLNVKSLVVKNHSEQTRVVRIEKSNRGPVTGADVKTDDQVEVINREHLIATLTQDVPFLLEMVIENGRGYVPATEHTPQAQEIGIIPLDAAFSPVTRVRYEVDETRVGQKTNYDRLIMEIWTNGTVAPDMALVEAAKILRKHLNAFVQHFEPGDQLDAEMLDNDVVATPQMNEELQNRLNQPIGTMDLSVRASNCLESAKIHTIGDLVKLTDGDLLKVRSFGKTSLREVKRKLQDLGLSLGMTLGAPPAVEPPAAAE